MAKQRVGIELFLDDSKLKPELAQADQEVKTWAGGVASSMTKIASVGQGLFFTINGFSQAFRVLNEWISKPIDTASDYDEVFSKFNVVFGEYTENVRQWAKDVGNAETGFGRSEMALLSMLSTMQDTFVPMGFARKEASELSKSLVALAVDVASFNNKMDEDVIADFQSAIVGNHETVRKYGIVITEATLKEEALTSGITDNVKAMTNEEKIRARLNIITKGTTDAQGDALRTAKGDANTRKRLNAILEDTSKILGEKLLPANTAWLEVQIALAKTVQDFIKIPIYEKLEEERKAVNVLAIRITSLNEKSGDRAKLLAEMQREYPDFLENLDIEKTTNEDLVKALEKYNKEMIKKVRVAKIDEQRAEIIGKQTEKAEKLVDAEIAVADAIFEQSERFKTLLDSQGFVLDSEQSLEEQAKSLSKTLGLLDYKEIDGVTTVTVGGVQKLTGAVLGLTKHQEAFNIAQSEGNDELERLDRIKTKLVGGSTEEVEDDDSSKKKKKTHEEYLLALKNDEWEFTEYEQGLEEERLSNIEKIRAEEQEFKDQVRDDEAKKDLDAFEEKQDRETAHYEKMIDLAVDMGDALIQGYNSEGLKGALRESLLLLLSFYEKRLLLEKFEAGAKAIGGNPGAIAELLFITAGFEAVKASVRNFATGAIVKARSGGMLVNVAEDGADEGIFPLSGPHSPFPGIVAELRALREDIKNTPPQLINSEIKGEDLKLLIDKQLKKKLVVSFGPGGPTVGRIK